MSRLFNRRAVMGGMIALPVLALGRMAQSRAPLLSQSGPIGPEDFMALSRNLTGHGDLSFHLGARILAVLDDNGRAAPLRALYVAMSEVTTDALKDHEEILRLVLHGWYLGQIAIDGETHLTGYEETLMGRVTADILPLRSYCGGAMGFWADPPDIGAVPLREAGP